MPPVLVVLALILVSGVALTGEAKPAAARSSGRCQTTNGTKGLSLFAATISGLQASINGVVIAAPGTSLTGINWAWGDGSTQAGCVYFPESHIYAKGGTYTVQVTATFSDGSQLQASEQVIVAGSGSTMSVTVSPNYLAWGNVPVGTDGGIHSVSVTNSGSGTMHISDLSITGPNENEFSIPSGLNGCAGKSIGPRGSCSFDVDFSPGASGSRTAELEVNDNAPGSPQPVPLSGNGEGTAISFVTPFPDQASPHVLIDGSGFGTNFPKGALNIPSRTAYLKIQDLSRGWSAGHTGDTCTLTVSQWLDNQISLRADVDGLLSACPLSVGDTVKVTVTSTSVPGLSAEYETQVVAPGPAARVDAVSTVATPASYSLPQAYGPQGGGNVVSVRGSGFSSGSSTGGVVAVNFGPYSTTDFTVNSDTSLTATAPAASLPVGVSLTVTTKDGETSPAGCLIIQLGCPNAYFYMEDVLPSISVPLDGLTVSLSHEFTGGACSKGTGGCLTATDTLGGSLDISITESFDAGYPAAVVGSVAGDNVTNAFSFSVSPYTFDVEKLFPYPVPVPALPGVLDLYDRVAGSVDLHYALNADSGPATFHYESGFVNGEALSSTSQTFSCSSPCVTLKGSIGLKGEADLDPLWLQLGQLGTDGVDSGFRIAAGLPDFHLDGQASLDITCLTRLTCINATGSASAAIYLLQYDAALQFKAGPIDVSLDDGGRIGKLWDWSSTSGVHAAAIAGGVRHSMAGSHPSIASFAFARSPSGLDTALSGNRGRQLLLQQLQAPPTGVPVLHRSIAYFVVSAPRGNRFKTVTVRESDPRKRHTLYFWTGASWKRVPGQRVSRAHLLLELSAKSTPSIRNLERRSILFALG